MIHPDHEFETWQRQWQSQPAVPIDVRRLVQRDLRSRRAGLVGSILVTVVIGGGTSLLAARSGQFSALVLAVAVWIFIAAAWVITFRLERLRGHSPSLTDTTMAFLDYAIRSRQARQVGIVASALLYVVFLGFMLGWRYQADAGEGRLSPWEYMTSARVTMLLIVSVALGAFAIYRRRRLGGELQRLMHIRNALRGAP